MIRRLLTLFGFYRKTDLHRAHRAYRLALGKAVLVKNSLELTWLEDDYEEMYGVTPIFRSHPHPALNDEEQLVSLKSEIRTSWKR